MNTDCRDIVPVTRAASSAGPPPDPDRESSDRTTSGQTSSGSRHANVGARVAPQEPPPIGRWRPSSPHEPRQSGEPAVLTRRASKLARSSSKDNDGKKGPQVP